MYVSTGHSYEVDSSLKKNSKQYTHTINMKTHNGHLLTATSTYRASKGNAYDVTSDIQLDGFKPVKVRSEAINFQFCCCCFSSFFVVILFHVYFFSLGY